jgi:hypothetical protein
MRSLRSISLGALLALPWVGKAVPAQEFSISPRQERVDSYRMAAGGSFNYGAPVGTFHDYVAQGFGLDGFFRWNADRRGILSLRVDGGFLTYGNETKRVPLSSTIGGRIRVDLTTSNNIVWMGVGPQITLPLPGLRPYVNAAAGFSYFFTESSIQGSNSNENIASTNNYDDGTFSWGGGGGFLIPFKTRRTEVALDLGVRYHSNGEVQYLRKGGIVDLPDGTIRLNTIQSEANLVTYRIGVSVSIP